MSFLCLFDRIDPRTFSSLGEEIHAQLKHNDKYLCCLMSNPSIKKQYNVKRSLRSLRSTRKGCLFSPSEKLTLLGAGKIGSVWKLVHDKKLLALKISKVSGLPIASTVPPTSLATFLKPSSSESSLDQISACVVDREYLQSKHNPTWVYVGSPDFYNETIIASILEHEYKRSSSILPRFFVQHYMGALCGNNGLNLMEMADKGTLLDFANKAPMNDFSVFTVLKQLFVALDWMQKSCFFVSSDLKPANILISSTHAKGTYKEIVFDDPFTLQIADYGKASATYKRYRFYPQNKLANLYLSFFGFSPKIGQHQTGDYYYEIPPTLHGAAQFSYSRHAGIPFYHSFDIYTIMVTLLMIRDFYLIIMNSKFRLKQYFWDPLFSLLNEEQKCHLDQTIQSYHLKKQPRFHHVVEILVNLPLHCVVLPTLLSNLRLYQSLG
jgi:serine/threonine protein kinase